MEEVDTSKKNKVEAHFSTTNICVLNSKSVRGTRKDNKNFRVVPGKDTRAIVSIQNTERFRRTEPFAFKNLNSELCSTFCF